MDDKPCTGTYHDKKAHLFLRVTPGRGQWFSSSLKFSVSLNLTAQGSELCLTASAAQSFSYIATKSLAHQHWKPIWQSVANVCRWGAVPESCVRLSPLQSTWQLSRARPEEGTCTAYTKQDLERWWQAWRKMHFCIFSPQGYWITLLCTIHLHPSAQWEALPPPPPGTTVRTQGWVCHCYLVSHCQMRKKIFSTVSASKSAIFTSPKVS